MHRSRETKGRDGSGHTGTPRGSPGADPGSSGSLGMCWEWWAGSGSRANSKESKCHESSHRASSLSPWQPQTENP